MRKVFTSFKSLASLGLSATLGLATIGLAACGSPAPQQQTQTTDDMGTGTMLPPAPTDQPAMAFNHDGTLGSVGDPFADGEELPASQSQYMHACGKVTYATLGNILSHRGVTITVGAQCTDSQGAFDCTAGSLYTNGNLVLGIANYPARAPESNRNSTGGIARLQDILVAAAEQLIVANTNPNGMFGATTDCSGTQLFNAGSPTTCNPDGFACFVGVPLTAPQLQLCNEMLTDPANTDPTVAKRLTLAALAATIYLCD